MRQVEDCPIYAGMIEAMDEAVGLVFDALDRFGLADNTVVCFTSDNGGASSGDSYSASMLPLRGGKGRQWEGGIREPLYVRFPGAVEPGTTCEVPVSGIDFYPTLLELAGLDAPGRAGRSTAAAWSRCCTAGTPPPSPNATCSGTTPTTATRAAIPHR